MPTQTQPETAPMPTVDEYITIVAATTSEVMQKFRESGLAAQGFAIAGRVVRHRFSYVGATDDPFKGEPMTAATFFRLVP